MWKQETTPQWFYVPTKLPDFVDSFERIQEQNISPCLLSSNAKIGRIAK